LRDEWGAFLGRAAVAHAKEVQAQGLERPADILLLGLARGRDVCVDLTVVRPTSLDSSPLSLERARRALNGAEDAKLGKPRSVCETLGWGLITAAFSLWGGMEPGA
jgi:hypothetical protein